MKAIVAILGSLNGSHISHLVQLRERDLSFPLFIADRDCPALKEARTYKIPNVKLMQRSFSKDFDRTTYTLELVRVLKEHKVDLVVMAGFMTVLDRVMFAPGNYENRVLNTHPSLLPAFPGGTAVQDTLNYEHGVQVTGCTIHVATAKLDAGPIVMQVPVMRLEEDTLESLSERIKIEERAMYPSAVLKHLEKMKNLGMI